MSSDADGRGGREGGAEAEKGEGDRGSADGGKGRAGDAGAGKGAARREIEAGARRRSLPAARPSSGHLSARAAWVDALAAPLAPVPLMAAAAAAVAALAPLRRNALRLLARVLRPRVQRIARTDEAGWQGICRSAFDERRSVVLLIGGGAPLSPGRARQLAPRAVVRALLSRGRAREPAPHAVVRAFSRLSARLDMAGALVFVHVAADAGPTAASWSLRGALTNMAAAFSASAPSLNALTGAAEGYEHFSWQARGDDGGGGSPAAVLLDRTLLGEDVWLSAAGESRSDEQEAVAALEGMLMGHARQAAERVRRERRARTQARAAAVRTRLRTLLRRRKRAP